MVRDWNFDSIPLGKELRMTVASPFLDEAVVAAALAFTKEESVQLVGEKSLGKIPLRHAFPGVHSCWRGKDPIEVGSGTTALGARPWLGEPGYFDGRVSDAEFAARRARALAEDQVELRDKEHLHYYTVFRDVFPGGAVSGKPQHGKLPCSKCRYELHKASQTFCRTCGHYDPKGVLLIQS